MKGINYIQFLWKSTNEHGVHSPFVYNFITKCFYSTRPVMAEHDNPALSKRQLALAYRLLNCRKPTKLFVLGENAANLTETLRVAGESLNMRLWFCSTLARVPGGIDMAYISNADKGNVLNLFDQMLPDIHNDTLCVIANIHSSREMQEAWQALQNHPKVIVTIDTYHTGLIFFRREQAKQHFTVRLSQSVLLDAVLGVRNLYGLIG